MSQDPSKLLDRELLVFVGKGGVGKTTTSSAVALKVADSGKRTLLVTIDPAKRLKDCLGVDVGYEPKKVRKNLWAMMLDPEKVITEYLAEHHPEQDVEGHPLYKYISNYMPGINELIGIGKLIEFREEKNFDTIVIDTAPTGHALSFLTTPLALRDLFKENLLLRWAVRGYSIYRKVAKGGRALTGLFGNKENLPSAPDVDFEKIFERISQDGGKIQALLADPERTTLSIVTLPEKLPVRETLDLEKYVSEKLGITVGYVVVNKIQPDALRPNEKEFDRLQADRRTKKRLASTLVDAGYPEALAQSLLDSTEFNEIRHRMNAKWIKELEEKLPDTPQVLLPLHRRDISGIDRLTELEIEFFQGFKTASAAQTKVVAPQPA